MIARVSKTHRIMTPNHNAPIVLDVDLGSNFTYFLPCYCVYCSLDKMTLILDAFRLISMALELDKYPRLAGVFFLLPFGDQ